MKILDYDYPDDRKYLIDSTPSHLWFKEENAINSLLLGVTDFFQNQIGEIYKITLKKIGDVVLNGKTISLIQAKNYSAILKTPINFKIIEINEEVVKKPKIINSDPYSSGWIYKIQIEGENNFDSEKLVPSSDSKLKTYLEQEKKNNSLLADDCCPDLISKSGAIRRKKQKKV